MLAKYAECVYNRNKTWKEGGFLDTTLLEAQSFWPHLSDAQKTLLRERSHIAHFAAGEAIKTGSSNCIGPLFVIQGILRVYLLSADGREATIYRLRAGETCVLSASCVLSAMTFDVQIDAETDCEVVIIPSPVFAQLVDNNLYVENFVYRSSTERLSDLIQAVERMFFMTLRQRVAAFLIDESASSGKTTLCLTQEQLARAIGSAREAVSRILKQLSQTGSIEVSRGGIRILDKAMLYRELSEKEIR